MKALVFCFVSVTILAAESPLGKIHRYDSATGKAEIRITPGTQVPGKIYIESGARRVLCKLRSTLHTKIICQTEKALQIAQGAVVYDAPGAESKAATGSSPTPAAKSALLGTRWKGTDSENRLYEFIFDKDGVLEYISPTGKFRNGTWKQEANVVRMEMNNHYSDYEGTISGEAISGNARNVTGKTWTWQVLRQAP